VLETVIRAGDAVRGAPEPEVNCAADYPFRAGSYVLSLFSTALNGLVLSSLAKGPKRLAELRRQVGGPAQTTLRGNLRTLIGIGALEKRRSNGNGGMVDHALTPAGAELLRVANGLDAWLSCAPDGPVRIDSETGKATVKALVGGWESTMLRALAAGPFSLTELDNLITAFSYPSLERRLGAMRLVGCVTPVEGNGGGTPYEVTDWLRRGMAPLLAAVRCERRHLAGDTAPLTRLDVETILLLSAPLVSFESTAAGTSQLCVFAGNGSQRRLAGVSLTVDGGRLAKISSNLESRPPSLVRGSAADWLDALVEGDTGRLEVRGEDSLTHAFVDSLHTALFNA
jgi:DNA-binding HxlR family transcriptional regulator